MYNHKNLYEDEESKKMMDAIHKAYRKDIIEKYEKKEHKKTIAIIILAVIFVGLLFGVFMVHVNKDTEKVVNQCVKDGHSLNYCQNKYYM